MRKQYKERDIIELDLIGGHYARHVNAMTDEGLISKSDIAAELAARDAEIEFLRMRLKEIDLICGQLLTTARAAIIESKADTKDGSNLAVEWIYNYLEPRNELPPDDASDAQKYFDDENKKIDEGLKECYRFFSDIYDARKSIQGNG